MEDAEIIERVLSGQRDLFAELVVRHGELVSRIVARHVAGAAVREVVHDAFVRAYQGLSSFKGESPFSHWISVVAVRTCYDYWRGIARRKERSIDEELDLVRDAVSKEAWHYFNEQEGQRGLRQLLQLALAELSAEDRMVVTLVHLEERSVGEVAELLGWTAVNVKVRAFRTRKKLKDIIERLMSDGSE